MKKRKMNAIPTEDSNNIVQDYIIYQTKQEYPRNVKFNFHIKSLSKVDPDLLINLPLKPSTQRKERGKLIDNIVSKWKQIPSHKISTSLRLLGLKKDMNLLPYLAPQALRKNWSKGLGQGGKAKSNIIKGEIYPKLSIKRQHEHEIGRSGKIHREDRRMKSNFQSKMLELNSNIEDLITCTASVQKSRVRTPGLHENKNSFNCYSARVLSPRLKSLPRKPNSDLKSSGILFDIQQERKYIKYSPNKSLSKNL